MGNTDDALRQAETTMLMKNPKNQDSRQFINDMVTKPDKLTFYVDKLKKSWTEGNPKDFKGHIKSIRMIIDTAEKLMKEDVWNKL
jgi:hypothetical protein